MYLLPVKYKCIEPIIHNRKFLKYVDKCYFNLTGNTIKEDINFFKAYCPDGYKKLRNLYGVPSDYL